MALWLKRTISCGFRTEPLNLDINPCPTIMAGGIAGGNCSQYYLEGDSTMVKPRNTKTEKPAYRVPSVEEIRNIPANGFSVVSTFAGCGGSSLGYRMAGFKILLANEFVKEARDSYSANKAPYTLIDPRDIRDITAEDLLEKIGLQVGELDVLDGSPPCASFSTAGKREKYWGKEKKYSNRVQRTDDLFFEFARLIEGMQHAFS